MKLEIVHRDLSHFNPAKGSIGQRPVYRNPDASLHPLEKPRELQRALVATKMEKMFSKPLISILDGHRDSVGVLARCHTRLADLFTGSYDGEIRHWDIARKSCVRSIRAHEGFVRGLVSSLNDQYLLSCGNDGIIKQWEIPAIKSIEDLDIENFECKGNLVELGEEEVTEALSKVINPINVWNCNSPVTSVDYSWSSHVTFLSTSDYINVWDTNRSTPVHSFSAGTDGDAAFTAKFNPAESHLFATSATDNSIGLFDLRSSSRVQRLVLRLRSNALCWNPMSPCYFTLGNDDGCLYTFDMRRLTSSTKVHKDFVNAVLSIDYSPTGREFVAGSFDKTLRIFKTEESRSREIYHGKRMQMVLSVAYSADSRFVFSGSADFCVRIWKSVAWGALGPQNYRERKAAAYREKLKNRYKDVPVVKRILRHRHLPKHVKKTAEIQRAKKTAQQKREMNRELYSSAAAAAIESTEIRTAKQKIIKKVEA